ncbi:MAG TPA: DUF1800 domain-containing protein [Pyrinomonadaceae bacterium]|nr:DUF1800 domain-containing protein [Pyrinomonadaceae bacterium]
MICNRTRFLTHFLSAGFVLLLLISPVFAQEDPNPDSPTPVLISKTKSTGALVNSIEKTPARALFNRTEEKAYAYGSKITLFVTNIELMNGEGANAFRVYVQDQKGRLYRFPVLDIEPVRGLEWVYALTVKLQDEIRFWEERPAKGDVLVGVTWRGLASNRVRLSLDKTGGLIKDDLGAKPTPFPTEPIKKLEEFDNPDYIGYKHSGDRIRFLEQATFGPTVALDQRIRRIGLRTWLVEQLEAPYPSASNPYPNIPLLPVNIQSNCSADPACVRDHYSMYPVQNWFFKEALYGEPQLRHRVTWALSQIWVISGVDTQQSSWMLAYYQQLGKNSFGNYRQLMKDVTLNPGMGNYLDMVRSTRQSPNENFAREILQLFSIGLFMLNLDGTLQLDDNGQPIPTYTQETVNNFTKVFTGWTLCEVTGPECPNRTTQGPNYKDPMRLIQNNHDITAKTLLSYPNALNPTIPAGMNGNAELELALDNIFNHPNVAPFVSKLLIQHLVTSDPTPAYVGRVAAVFNNNGQGTRGDLKEVVRAILLDPEARGNVKTDPNYGKLREPVQIVTNFLRQFNVRSANLSQQSDGVINNLTAPLGQNVFNAPTVFNYYSPDYVIPGTSLLGPEFGIRTTGTAIGVANVINTMTFARINASANAPLGTAIDLSEMTALAQNDPTSNQLLDTLNQRMMHGTMSPQVRGAILTAVQAVPATNPQARAQQAIYLIATSSQYQVQR